MPQVDKGLDPQSLERNVNRLLAVCREHNVLSTCFVVGEIAEQYPSLIRKIHAAGHEIAAHSHSHKLLYELTPQEFIQDLRQCTRAIEGAVGVRPYGFRAPSWSVNSEILPWYYEGLIQEGYTYSSSIYPAKTYLFGIEGADRQIHQPVIHGDTLPIWEIPVPITSIMGKKIGYSGGIFLRLFPAWFIERVIKSQNRQGISSFIYLHPREFEPKQVKISLSPLEAFIHYYGLKTVTRKLQKLIKTLGPTLDVMGQQIGEINQTKLGKDSKLL